MHAQPAKADGNVGEYACCNLCVQVRELALVHVGLNGLSAAEHPLVALAHVIARHHDADAHVVELRPSRTPRHLHHLDA